MRAQRFSGIIIARRTREQIRVGGLMTIDARLATEVVDSLVDQWQATNRLCGRLDPDGTCYVDEVEKLRGVTLALERIVDELRSVHPLDSQTEYAVKRAIEVLSLVTPARKRSAT